MTAIDREMRMMRISGAKRMRMQMVRQIRIARTKRAAMVIAREMRIPGRQFSPLSRYRATHYPQVCRIPNT